MSPSRRSSSRHASSAACRPGFPSTGFSTTGFSPTRFLSDHFPASDLPPEPPFRHSQSKPSRLSRELRERLLSLSYRAFLQAVLHLLSATGYAQVIPTGRSGFKGRNTGGGWDLEAQGFTDGGEAVRAIAQVKQFRTLSVQQRTVDELRGCLLRAQADEAWLITLSTFSAPAQAAAQAGGGTAPIRLLDGDALAEQMVRHQVGICRKGKEWIVNDRYFQSLEQRFSKETGQQKARQSREAQPEPSQGQARHGGTMPPRGRAFSLRERSAEPAPLVRVTILCGRYPKD